MDKKMENEMVTGRKKGISLGFIWGLCWDNGKKMETTIHGLGLQLTFAYWWLVGTKGIESPCNPYVVIFPDSLLTPNPELYIYIYHIVSILPI